jgi:fatty acid desaturase
LQLDYRHFHSWHHRYTQDPGRDPELMFPKAASRLAYLREISGAMFWYRRAIDYPALAFGRARHLPFVPASARRSVALSMSAQLAIYLAGAVSAALGFSEVLYFWFFRHCWRSRYCAPCWSRSTPDAARTETA